MKLPKAINSSLEDIKKADKAIAKNKNRRVQTETSKQKPSTKEYTIMGS